MLRGANEGLDGADAEEGGSNAPAAAFGRSGGGRSPSRTKAAGRAVSPKGRRLVAEPVVWRRASVMDRWVLRVLPQLLLRSCGSHLPGSVRPQSFVQRRGRIISRRVRDVLLVALHLLRPR